jgi:hypothetical protein
MANRLYDKGRQKFLEGKLAWLTDTVRAVLVNTGLYNPDLESDEFLSDIPPAARAVMFGPLAGKTSAAGVADADDASVGYLTAASVEALVLYRDTGDETTSALIAYVDDVLNLPFTPQDEAIRILWSNGPDRIFRL